MNIKISGFGSIVGYTILNEKDLDWLYDNIGSNFSDKELTEFCSDDRIWEEIRFKYKIIGPSISAQVQINDKPTGIVIESENVNTLPKFTNISGNDGIFTVIHDFKGVWFSGEINAEEFEAHKLRFETMYINGIELVTKVIYNKKEIVNEITNPLIRYYNTYASLEF